MFVTNYLWLDVWKPCRTVKQMYCIVTILTAIIYIA